MTALFRLPSKCAFSVGQALHALLMAAPTAQNLPL